MEKDFEVISSSLPLTHSRKVKKNIVPCSLFCNTEQTMWVNYQNAYRRILIKKRWGGQRTHLCSREVSLSVLDCKLAWATRKPPEAHIYVTCLSVTLLSPPLTWTLTLLSLSVVSRRFASTHCHPSVRPWPIKRDPAPISFLQLRWLFLDSIPPLISSSEISFHGSWWLVEGCWGLGGWGGVRRETEERCAEESVVLDVYSYDRSLTHESHRMDGWMLGGMDG